MLALLQIVHEQNEELCFRAAVMRHNAWAETK